ncbi:D-alanyl-lipoteichoic acid biosynthesis protein DltB [Clostridium tagluense]|uniref:D-alanyl-lipoteichoic acid biosynthesis protein DltB n=1 Tax=Clostridium TaxID=1485 RepID=UPI0013E940FE|nr:MULTISPECIES: D-alanyl-lipoteichoic acid biosynthesis protein DltB [Clostridium]MBU3127265.1 D-alanyl-lipoteichoic acid biosynthesis protein DltB [Clostridium tagluense]MBW9155440.1 D-alanyl-lipoteichoic acid biosynthesis protein DltB [Clostridium tagluense]MBZ9621750.1 D-alanyl-lipoteichoic acid biosynthesis protein DltB [Clostridium sp. FP2]MCB2312261.1 D-alanyl-lipoteichoic acid biosynthesis protein DltB [Clostridium tagluense]MCB2317001.1 D-alanyl-lipoteichoic acid biosynthesis protein 
MLPYGDFLYFYLMILVLIPAIVVGLLGKRIKWYGLPASLFMIYLIFGNSRQQVEYLIVFFVMEFLLIIIYSFMVRKFKQRWLLWIIILIGLSPLIYSKFSNIFIHKELGFLGISYLTFKVIQMLIQIFDGYITKINIFDLAYFILFFPTLSSGPLDRSIRFMEESNKVIKPRQYVEYLGDGLFKILQGVGYKFLIGYYIQEHLINIILLRQHTLINAIKYMYSYSFYLFFDFAGYSLIAIGVSYIMGIRTPENFNLPFISKDIKDFWNRWHMSLSFWFRDFIYNRFVMSALKKKWFKSKYTASYIGYMITMTTMGLWHGIQLNYIVYGAYHGILIIVTDYFQRKVIYKKVKGKVCFKIASTVATFNLICFSFLIFSGYLFK